MNDAALEPDDLLQCHSFAFADGADAVDILIKREPVEANSTVILNTTEDAIYSLAELGPQMLRADSPEDLGGNCRQTGYFQG